MKTKILKIICLFILVLISNDLLSLNGKGKIIVYFSREVSNNRLYAILLKMKFPNLDTVVVASDEEFIKHIPLKTYIERKSKERKNSGSVGFSVSDSGNRMPPCYFFDIYSETKWTTFYAKNPQGLEQAVTSSYEVHSLYLMRYESGRFDGYRLKILDTRKKRVTKASLEFSQFENISDDINPVLLTMYVYALSDTGFYKKGDYNSCELNKNDSIYFCPISNNEYVSRKFGAERRERKFRERIKYFKHAHIKLQSAAFAQKAIDRLKSGKSFYFYYFISDIPDPTVMVIDLKTFDVVYCKTKKLKAVFIDIPMKKYIKKSSKRLVCPS